MPSAYAQDKNTKNDNPFANASAKQIKEAQSYYEYCKNDKVLSEEKDCRCASAAYLDTRMKLGDEVSKKEIAQRLRFKCSKFAFNTPEKGATDVEKDDGYFKDVTDKQIEEAQGVYLNCKENPTMSRYNDCECLASSFLELRLQKGPIPRQDRLLFELDGKCKDLVQSTGYAYTSCMGDQSNDQYGFDRKDYCECYARRWVDQYKNLNVGLNIKSDINMQATAKIYCQSMAGIEAKKHQPAEESSDQETAQ